MTEQNQTRPGMAGVVERNLEALLTKRRAEEERRSPEERLADAITAFTGSMKFVYLHLGVFGAWIIWNLPWVPTTKFDPSFIVLAMFASVEAIFLSTFVLITQNRMRQSVEKRAELDLQISLLAEHEVTKLIDLVSAIAERMQIEQAHNPELPELKQDIVPETVLQMIEEYAGSKKPRS
jgi:uncharacterized membrane protein